MWILVHAMVLGSMFCFLILLLLEGKSDNLWEQASDYEDEEDCSSGYDTYGRIVTPLEVTLTSLTETGLDESTIPVLNQRTFMGTKVISSSLADTLCIDLSINGMLKELNTALGTSYNLDSVNSILEPYITQNVDFGTAYAYLWPYWDEILKIVHKLRTQEAEDKEMQQNVLMDGKITNCHVPPRRVWDLCANWVVPCWMRSWLAEGELWAISHAWVDEKERVDVMTSINRCEWPVPMLKDANLDLIRIEMLNIRQEGGNNEHLRLKEWELDMPTIGSVYEHADRGVYYFNGLGRPLHLTLGYFESDRCWFRHAWMLQEMMIFPIIAGVTGKDVVDTQIQRRFDEELKSLQKRPGFMSVLHYVSDMQNWVSTKPLDKITGLVYPLRPFVIPIYDPKQSPEESWEVLMDVMGFHYQMQLLFHYPEPGDGKKCWRPSWLQVMSQRIVFPRYHFIDNMFPTKDLDMDSYIGYCIRSANVCGLGEVPNEPMPQQGEVDFNDDNGAPCTLKIIADHMHPIPNGIYTLLGSQGRMLDQDHWVVGKIRQDGKFEKWTVNDGSDYVFMYYII
ncbi:hypothetical protein EDD18DRAFT_1440940 [Armillaria luteobubalina]|uniref:Heterokaryon incompatibility domain-containing protein n=1 Tax=Armillaria luteobubalina TaxID=153913 RepID=A0AA39QCQ4_9AGAR|nr:hypothetical protein EDD18DRAFT_1440940 [Armillaria luteobubalina]